MNKNILKLYNDIKSLKIQGASNVRKAIIKGIAITVLNSKEKNGIFIKEISLAEIEENQKASRDCPVRIIKIIKN